MSTAANPAVMAAIAEANMRSIRKAIDGSLNGTVSIRGGGLVCTVEEASAYLVSLQAHRDALAEMAEVRRELGMRL